LDKDDDCAVDPRACLVDIEGFPLDDTEDCLIEDVEESVVDFIEDCLVADSEVRSVNGADDCLLDMASELLTLDDKAEEVGIFRDDALADEAIDTMPL